MFVMRVNQDYFDLETIYDMIETISYQRRASLVNSKSFVEISNVSNIWEQDVYRRIAEYLRKHNLDVEKAFHKIDQDNSGLISSSEFRRFIESLDLDLSEIKVEFQMNQILCLIYNNNMCELGLVASDDSRILQRSRSRNDFNAIV